MNTSQTTSSFNHNNSQNENHQPNRSDSMMTRIFSSGYVPVSNHIFDKLMAELSGSEYKVYMYIYRRTVGFRKESDSIALSQFANGIVTKEGKVLDRGTGLGKATIIRCLDSLEQKGYVIRYRGQSDVNDSHISIYQLNLFLGMPPYNAPIQEVISKPDEAHLSIDDIMQEEIGQAVVTENACNPILENIPEPLSTIEHTQPQQTEFSFAGFDLSRLTSVPDQFFDELLPILSGSESKVLAYIFRRTLGFHKISDDISLNQMLHGITTSDGRQLDQGVGLARSTLIQALHQLADKRIVIVEKNQNPNGGADTTTYTLNIRENIDSIDHLINPSNAPESFSIFEHTQPNHSDIKIRQVWYNDANRLETFVYSNKKGS